MADEPKKKGKGKIIAIVVIIIILLVAIGSCSGGDDDTEVTNTSDGSSSSEETVDTSDSDEGDGTTYVLPGESFETDGLKITLDECNMDYQVEDNEYGLYDLDDGLKYVSATFTFENIGDSDEYVSIYDFDCYVNNTQYEQQYLPDGGDFINTNLSSGRNVSFTTYYAVPSDATEVELEYTSNVWTSEKVIIKLQ